MSGFVGLFNRNGAPITPALIERLTADLRFRGPDGQRTWRAGPIGFGHSLLAGANGPVPLPLSLGEDLWITGDIRLDARKELVSALAASGAHPVISHGDAALVLLAYRAWGADCVTRLAGDFSFAIWDAARRRLFCARDPFGVRPFFYALSQDCFAFSNTLQVLRTLPHNAQLDESAIADFLVFGMQQDAAATFFTGIRRLPGGHSLLADAQTFDVRAWYALPVLPRLRYRDPRQYAEHFQQVFTESVADRSPESGAVLQLSGGLDSATIAAALVGKFGAWRAPGDIRAVCVSWNRFFADPEGPLAQLSARTIGVPLEVWERDECEPHDAGKAALFSAPEPSLFRRGTMRNAEMLGAISPVVLNGQGGDELFYRELLVDELRATKDPQLLLDVAATWLRFGRPPLGLRTGLKSLFRTDNLLPLMQLPSWLNPGWSRQLHLRERVRDFNLRYTFPPCISRGSARVRLGNAVWQRSCEELDAFNTGMPVQYRWPFLDQRVVGYVLSLPPYPWCVDKQLLREVLSPILPPQITKRPKTPLQGDPILLYMKINPSWRDLYEHLPARMHSWVNPSAWRSSVQSFAAETGDGDLACALARVVALRTWLYSGY